MRMRFDPPADPGAYPFLHRLRVRFCETDAMAVVHHASYLAYLEETRVEYLRALGRPYDRLRAEGIEFPVVEAALQYRRPLRFDDVVDVSVMIASAGGATFQMSYLVACDGQTNASGVTVHGVIDGQGRPTRVPLWLRDLVPPDNTERPGPRRGGEAAEIGPSRRGRSPLGERPGVGQGPHAPEEPGDGAPGGAAKPQK